ncbi:MAG: hypothetical protein CVV11_05000 [Gammaproteobacteria bacterium HGW-Gammaproteobacteria-15]|nr:MAG: hypothetical protein CVV11_05000 [Gammaproteobacteria bacterium HGW-Gammaproteobacteria-15]
MQHKYAFPESAGKTALLAALAACLLSISKKDCFICHHGFAVDKSMALGCFFLAVSECSEYFQHVVWQ